MVFSILRPLDEKTRRFRMLWSLTTEMRGDGNFSALSPGDGTNYSFFQWVMVDWSFFSLGMHYCSIAGLSTWEEYFSSGTGRVQMSLIRDYYNISLGQLENYWRCRWGEWQESSFHHPSNIRAPLNVWVERRPTRVGSPEITRISCDKEMVSTPSRTTMRDLHICSTLLIILLQAVTSSQVASESTEKSQISTRNNQLDVKTRPEIDGKLWDSFGSSIS